MVKKNVRSIDDLPEEILEKFAEKLTDHEDLLRFAAVSKSWRKVVMASHHRLPHRLPLCYCLRRPAPAPLLMHSGEAAEVDTLNLFSIADHKYITKLSLPDTKKWRILGSSYGWLVMGEVNGWKIHLQNPLTGDQIALPPHRTLTTSRKEYPEITRDPEDYGWCFNKAVISCDPTGRNAGDDCVVVAMVADRGLVCYCRPGDRRWVEALRCDCSQYLCDVIYHKDQFYVINSAGLTIAFNVPGDRYANLISKCRRNSCERYLVRSTSGNLLQVARITRDDCEKTTGFSVYTLKVVNKPKAKGHDQANVARRGPSVKWVKLHSLGDLVLFIREGSSVCLPAEYVPGYRRNCIYFVNDDHSPIRNFIQNMRETADSIDYDDAVCHSGMCVYDMGNKSIEPIGDLRVEPFKLAAWFSPNPW